MQILVLSVRYCADMDVPLGVTPCRHSFVGVCLSTNSPCGFLSLSQEFSRGLLSHKERRRELQPPEEVREMSGWVRE